MERNDITFSLHLTLDGKEHLVTAAAAGLIGFVLARLGLGA